MSMFGSVSKGRLGGWFNVKAPENLSALAVLVEIKAVRQAPHPKREGEMRDVLDADWTVFQNKDQLTGKAEPVILANATCTDTCPVRDLKELGVGGKALVKCETAPNRRGGNPIAVVNDIEDPAIIELAEAYVTKRDAATDAALSDLGL